MNHLLADAVREAWKLNPTDAVRTFRHAGTWALGVRVQRGWRVAGVIVPISIVLGGQTMDYLTHHAPEWVR